MSSQSLTNLDDLVRGCAPHPDWRLELVLPEIGGGKLGQQHLSVIETSPNSTALRISGLDQNTFEQLIERYGSRFSGIYFWKCPRLVDLTPLEALSNLRFAAFFWNQRTTRLWDFSRTPNLRGLFLKDFTRLHDLSDLRAATSLEELEIGGMVWRTAVFHSLEPLESLGQLKTLRFDAKHIRDGRIEPLAQLRNLKSLEFPANQFTTRQVAWLRAHMPDSLSARSLEPVWSFMDRPIGQGDKQKDVLVVGKGKPWLNSKRHAKRIERYVDEFWTMVKEFRQNPELLPDEA